MAEATTYPHNDGEHIINEPPEFANVEAFDAWLLAEQEDAAAKGQTIHLTQDGQYVGLTEIEEGVGYFAI